MTSSHDSSHGLPASLLGLASRLSDGRGPRSASDELPSGAGLEVRTSRFMRRAELRSLGIVSPQSGQRCPLSASVFGTQERHRLQNWVEPQGSTKRVSLPEDSAFHIALRAKLDQDASEIDFARWWFLSIPETFSFSRTRTSLSLKILLTTFFCQSSLCRLM